MVSIKVQSCKMHQVVSITLSWTIWHFCWQTNVVFVNYTAHFCTYFYFKALLAPKMFAFLSLLAWNNSSIKSIIRIYFFTGFLDKLYLLKIWRKPSNTKIHRIWTGFVAYFKPYLGWHFQEICAEFCWEIVYLLNPPR